MTEHASMSVSTYVTHDGAGAQIDCTASTISERRIFPTSPRGTTRPPCPRRPPGRSSPCTVTTEPSGVQTPAALQTIVIDLGDGMEAGGSGLDGMTQFAATSALNQVRSDDAYPSACAIELPGLTAADFRCWYASWD